MKIKSYLYETLEVKENDKLNLNKSLYDYKNEAISVVFGIYIIMSGLIFILCGLLLKQNHVLHNQGELARYSAIALVSLYALLIYLYLKDLWFKLLFSYKYDMMNNYYRLLGEKIREYQTPENPAECTLVLAPRTSNGRLIGALEALLYSFAIIIQNYTLLGIILAVRSYVTVKSHPNKEESEFYIIGLLGSLLYSIVFTIIYVVMMRSFFEFNIISEVSIYFN